MKYITLTTLFFFVALSLYTYGDDTPKILDGSEIHSEEDDTEDYHVHVSADGKQWRYKRHPRIRNEEHIHVYYALGTDLATGKETHTHEFSNSAHTHGDRQSSTLLDEPTAAQIEYLETIGKELSGESPRSLTVTKENGITPTPVVTPVVTPTPQRVVTPVVSPVSPVQDGSDNTNTPQVTVPSATVNPIPQNVGGGRTPVIANTVRSNEGGGGVVNVEKPVSLMSPPPKRKRTQCYLPRSNRRVEIESIRYDAEFSAILIKFRNWDVKPVILNRYTVALYNKDGEKIHRTTIGKSRFRYRGRLYIGKRSRKQEYRDSTFAVIQRKHLKSVFPKVKEKHGRIGSAFVMFHPYLFNGSWTDKEWTVKISCGKDVVFQYPPEVTEGNETDDSVANAPMNPYLKAATTWASLKRRE